MARVSTAVKVTWPNSDYRSKSVITVLTPIQIRRAYYHCSACERGVIPKDKELDIRVVLPFIDEKPGSLGLREHDRFRFSAIEELGQFRHVGAFGDVLAGKPTRIFGLRQSERVRSRRFELKLLEHRLWD